MNKQAFRTLSSLVLVITSATMIVLTQTPAADVARAADLAEQAHSLRLAPTDAALYSVSLRMKEQFDIFKHSNAYARLMEIPVLQMAKMQATFQLKQSPAPPLAKLRKYVESPDGKDTVALLKEMAGDEVFAYAGSDIAGALKLAMDLNGVMRTARIESAASGEKMDKVLSRHLRESLAAHQADFKVPTIVLGFRVKDKARANRQIELLHTQLQKQLEKHQAELADQGVQLPLAMEQVGGNQFMTLRLNASMIPWDKIRAEAEDEEEVDKWHELLKDKSLAVALGAVDEFVVFSIGSSTDHLANLGKGAHLAENPAIQRLAKHADQRVVSAEYLSESFAKSLSSPEKTVADIADTVDEAMQQAKAVTDEQRKQIVDDIRALKLDKYMPKPGAVSGIAFLTSRGYEGFHYSTGTKPMMDSSKALSILNHVGGSPMLLVASHSSDSLEDYDAFVAWARQLAKHIEQIAKSQAKEDDWDKYAQYRDRLIELARRLNKANREDLYAGFAEKQSAFVLDVSAESAKWFKQMPKSPKPLPMLEIGLVAGVSDPEKVRQGVKEYCAVVHDALALVREAHPDEASKIKLPKPEAQELSGGGKLYAFPLPKKAGVDSQIAPNAGLTDKAAAISSMPATTERLLADKPLTIDTSLDFKHRAAMVSYFDFNKFVNAVKPWLSYGLDVATGNIKAKDDEDAAEEDRSDQQSEAALKLGFVVPQVEQFLNVASAFRSASMMTYQEDGQWVTHSETHIEDLK